MEELPDMRATFPTRDVLTDTTSGAMRALTGRLRAVLERHPVGHAARTGHIGAPGSLVRTKQLVSLCRLDDVLRREAIPCGWVDLLNARCVLERYETIVDNHRRRRRLLDFSRHDYLAFCSWLAAALDPMKIRVEFKAATRSSDEGTRCLRPHRPVQLASAS